MHEIKIGNFRLGFQKFVDTNFSVRSAGKWIMLSFSLEENNCREDKAVWCGIRIKHGTHTCIQYGLSQPETQVSCIFLSAACGQQVCSILEMTGPTVVTVCWRWLYLPIEVHHVFVYIGLPRVPSTVPLKVLNNLFSSYYKILLKMHSFNSSHHCNTYNLKLLKAIRIMFSHCIPFD